jgi:hypothetical protein
VYTDDATVDVADGVANGVPMPHGPSSTYDGFLATLELQTGAYCAHTAYADEASVVVHDVAFRDGAIVLVGSFDASVDLGTSLYDSVGGADGFVAQLLPADYGEIWSHQIGGVGVQQPYAAAIDSVGDVVVVGTFDDTIDFGAGPQQASGHDAFIVKLGGTDGEPRWSGTYGGPDDDRALRVCTDDDDNVIVAGEFTVSIDFGLDRLQSVGGSDVFVAKFRPIPATE